VCGSVTNYEKSALKLLENDSVIKILDVLVRNPLTIEEIVDKTGLEKEDVTHLISDMINMDIVRKEGNVYILNFCLFSREDAYKLRELGFTFGEKLYRIILDNLEWIDESLAKTSCSKYTSLDMLRFIVVGAHTLDLKVLSLLYEKKLALCGGNRHPGGNYTLFGREISSKEDVSLVRGMYFGCHSDSWGKYTFRSFGDHSGLRWAFPDVVWRKEPLVMNRLLKLGKEIDVCVKRIACLLENIASDYYCARVRDSSLEYALDTLLELGYIECSDSYCRPIVPVFRASDMKIVRQISDHLGEIIVSFVEDNIFDIRSMLRDFRLYYWVDFRELFTEVWHWIFGATNNILACRGYFFKPIAKRKYEGEYIMWMEVS